jgi:hypothetical protein
MSEHQAIKSASFTIDNAWHCIEKWAAYGAWNDWINKTITADSKTQLNKHDQATTTFYSYITYVFSTTALHWNQTTNTYSLVDSPTFGGFSVSFTENTFGGKHFYYDSNPSWSVA